MKNLIYVSAFAVAFSILFLTPSAHATTGLLPNSGLGVAGNSLTHQYILPTINLPNSSLPWGVAYVKHLKEMFVTDYGGNRTFVINETSNALITTINDTSFAHPTNIAYDSHTHQLYVANHGSSIVSVIDVATNTVVKTIHVGNGAIGIAYDSHMNEIFVVNHGFASPINTVSVINDKTHAVVSTISDPSFNGPFSIAYDSHTNELYVTNTGFPNDDNTVSVINDATNSVVGTITVGFRPVGVAYDPHTNEIFVTNYGYVTNRANTVSVINDTTHAVVGTITSGTFKAPFGIAYNPNNNKIFVADQGYDVANTKVSVFSDESPYKVTTVPVGSGPQSIAFGSNPHKLFVTNYSSHSVSVIS